MTTKCGGLYFTFVAPPPPSHEMHQCTTDALATEKDKKISMEPAKDRLQLWPPKSNYHIIELHRVSCEDLI